MRKFSYAAIAAFAMLGILFAYLSAAAWGSMVWAKDKAMFYLETPISAETALGIWEQGQELAEQYRQGLENEAPLPFCIWGQTGHVLVSGGNLSMQTQVSAILFCGKPELLFEDCRVPVPEDVGGCLLDEQAAWELFGGTEVVGKEVSCGNHIFTIRDVIPGKEGLVAFQVSRGLLEKNSTKGQEPEGEPPLGMDEMMQRVTEVWKSGIIQITKFIDKDKGEKSNAGQDDNPFGYAFISYTLVYIIVLGVCFAAAQILYSIIRDCFTRKNAGGIIDEYSGSIGILAVGISILWSIRSGALKDGKLSTIIAEFGKSFLAVMFIVALGILSSYSLLDDGRRVSMSRLNIII